MPISYMAGGWSQYRLSMARVIPEHQRILISFSSGLYRYPFLISWRFTSTGRNQVSSGVFSSLRPALDCLRCGCFREGNGRSSRFEVCRPRNVRPFPSPRHARGKLRRRVNLSSGRAEEDLSQRDALPKGMPLAGHERRLTSLQFFNVQFTPKRGYIMMFHRRLRFGTCTELSLP